MYRFFFKLNFKLKVLDAGKYTEKGFWNKK